VQLLGKIQTIPELDPDFALKRSLTKELHGKVTSMNRDNFVVRMHLQTVECFQDRQAWDQLNEDDLEILQRDVAGLPSEIETDDITSRLFDLTVLRMQFAQAKGDTGAFERYRQGTVEIAILLEDR
jgi:type I restriction enzyme, R subunit